MFNLPKLGNFSNHLNKDEISFLNSFVNNIGQLPNIKNVTSSTNFSKNYNSEENYYSILGVNKTASQEDIKKAYRKLSLTTHPDRNGGNKEKCEIYKKINEAYKIIGNEEERIKYDFSLNNKFSESSLEIDPNILMGMFFGNTNTNSILNEISKSINNNFNKDFINNPFQKENNKPETIFKTLNISLINSFSGCKIPININRWIYENNIKQYQNEKIYLDIPKGIDNNEIITLSGKGNKINEYNKGDIEIRIILDNDENFERNGIDLIFKKSISLKESFCGFSFDLTYIDGREYKIKNEAGNVIPPDFKKIIPNMGLTRDNERGNLIIIFKVEYPKKLSDTQVESLKTIF